jgi:AmmeMemoRadiSam system protein B/AmmeMemoRadiSam system protein A
MPLLRSHPEARETRGLSAAAAKAIREAGVAGAFYPSDPVRLKGMMDVMLAGVDAQPVQGEILALLAPHAGYVYSGPVAAFSYAAIKGHGYERVIVIAPSHFVSVPFTSLYEGEGYETPLGVIPVDTDFVHRLVEADPGSRLSCQGHLDSAEASEHAIEVQLPWLQHVLGPFSLVPIIMGDQSYASCRSLGGALATLLNEQATPHHESPLPKRKTLIVASSDLSHYFPSESASLMDHRTLAALAAWDYTTMSRNFEAQLWEACGGGPIVTAIIAAERLGATQAKVLRYGQSGDVSGDHAKVVGYAAAVFLKAPHAPPEEPEFDLSREEKDALLHIARRSVEAAVRGEHPFKPDPPSSTALQQARGAFVTLHLRDELRGCVGYISGTGPLYRAVREIAVLAAKHDPRFRPVTVEELPALSYEISVLSPMRRIQNVHQIHVGKDGLLIRNRDQQGLLLPQVAAEQQWDAFRFLEETCAKAGLSRSAWTSDDTDIFAFTAIVFRSNEDETRIPPAIPPG